MAVTVTRMATGPGLGGHSPSYAAGARVTDLEVFKIAFDTSYPTGGESIAAALDEFKEVLYVGVQTHDVTVADNRHWLVDLTNKKLICLDAINTEEAAATDLSTITDLRLLVIGYK